MKRCHWAETNILLRQYHDNEWGVPVHDDRRLFEMLNLEGAQAGLSWLTILTKRDNYRRAFDDFDPDKIARYDETKRSELLQNKGIVRNRLKVNAFIENAKATLVVQQRQGNLETYLWSYISNRKLTGADHDEAMAMSMQMSKGLKKDGFRFVGPTTCYSFMQSVGMINDHEPACFQFKEL